MPKESVPLKPIRELVDRARRYPAHALPLETRQSYPIPVLRPEGLWVEFLFCTQRARPGSLQLLAPDYLADINAATGEFEPLKKVTPRNFGQSDPEGEFIGEHRLSPGTTYEESLAQEQRLYHDYDVLLPAFAAGLLRVTPEVKTAAADFKELFARLAERPLLPYYKVVGKDFFAWLDRIATG
jgi:hypothetical protein